VSPGICKIYYPGLLGPPVPLDELANSAWPGKHELPVLNRFFARGKVCALDSDRYGQSIESRILKLLGVTTQPDQIPVADLRHAYYGCSDDYQWCLDPVHIQIDLDEAILLANDKLLLNEHEARQIIKDINLHFAQDGLRVEYCAPHEWCLKGQLALTTSPLSEVMYKNINSYLPHGNDEHRWRQIINEIQMLLHGHTVNEQRLLQGKPTINSLWLWGSGQYNSIAKKFDLVCSDDKLATQTASLAGIAHKTLLMGMDSVSLANRNSLIILTGQMDMVRSKDVFGWFATLKKLDSQILAPIYEMLKKRQLKRIVLQSDTFEIILNQAGTNHSVFSWLKPEKSFQKKMIQLRSQYAN
jgi:hypothetical protein